MPHGRPLLASNPRSLRRPCVLTNQVALPEAGRPWPIAERGRGRGTSVLPLSHEHTQAPPRSVVYRGCQIHASKIQDRGGRYPPIHPIVENPPVLHLITSSLSTSFDPRQDRSGRPSHSLTRSKTKTAQNAQAQPRRPMPPALFQNSPARAKLGPLGRAIPGPGANEQKGGEGEKRKTSDDLQKSRWQVCIRTGTDVNLGGGRGSDQQIHVQLHVQLACCERAAASTCANLGSSKGPCRDRRGARPCTSSTSLRDRPLAYTRVSAYVDYTYVPRVNVWTTTTTGGGWGLEQQAMKSGPPGVQLTTALPSRFPYPGCQARARPGSRPTVTSVNHQTFLDGMTLVRPLPAGQHISAGGLKHTPLRFP